MPEEVKEKKKRSRAYRVVKLLLKIIITVLCFWYISEKIDFTAAINALTKAHWLYILAAILFFILSKLFSAFRLNIYFMNIGLHLSGWKNIRLYWIGMFYNLFLPGAISGDAYKVILLNRRYKTSYKKLSAAVLIDRSSGMLALAIIAGIYGLFVLDEQFLKLILAGIIAFAIPGFYFLIKFLFTDFLPGFVSTFLWGFAVQAAQVICIYLILSGLQIPLDQHEWIFIFLASAVITILPLSLGGGLGTREVVFAEGAGYFNLNPETGVVISLLFYIITVIGSLGGLYYNFRDPLGGEQ